MQIAIRHRTNAWRVVHVVECAGSLWVLHAFQKKSRTTLEVMTAMNSTFNMPFKLMDRVIFLIFRSVIQFIQLQLSAARWFVPGFQGCTK